MAKKSYGDEKYLDWLSRQPCVIDSGFMQYLNGEGRNIACHVRTAANAGVGYKPPFSAVPMKQVYHDIEHSKGYLYLLNTHRPDLDIITKEYAKAWFLSKAAQYLAQWRHETGQTEFTGAML